MAAAAMVMIAMNMNVRAECRIIMRFLSRYLSTERSNHRLNLPNSLFALDDFLSGFLRIRIAQKAGLNVSALILDNVTEKAMVRANC
jgi:hypothetical protein